MVGLVGVAGEQRTTHERPGNDRINKMELICMKAENKEEKVMIEISN